MESTNKLAKHLVARRKALKLSQQDVAVLLNVTRQTINNWENNIASMPLGKYQQLGEELTRLEKLHDDAQV